MTFRAFTAIALTSAALSSVACKPHNAQNDQKVAELQKQLADAQQQLAAGKQPAESAASSTPAEQALAQPPPPAVSTAPTAPAGSAQPAGTTGRSSKSSPKSASPSSTGADAAATKEQLNRQKSINAEQADTNANLQKQIEDLKPREVTIPAGTSLSVRTSTELSTKSLSDGSTFTAVLEQPLKASDVVVANKGSHVNGVVVSSDPGGRVKGTASLTVAVRSIVGAKGKVIPVSTDSYTVDAEQTKKKDATRTGVATGVGAIIGGIAGGGKGAAIGAGAGAAAGVGTNMATRGAAAVIPAEQLMELHLTSPVTITVQP